MKYQFAVIVFSLFLTGCKTINLFQSDNESHIIEKEKSALKNTDDVSPLSSLISDITETPIDFQPCRKTEKKVDYDAYSDLWTRIQVQLSFDIPDNKQIKKYKNWIQKRPEYLPTISKRAEPYLFFIVEELEKNNMPIELALLPIVESAFDPFAYSHGSASGMWQFIASTGKSFGLKQNWWYDGRRDVYLSTQAAIKYLKYLHNRFDNNWLHALAAYNSGEGYISRAIKNNKRKNKKTDIWSLKLPKETQSYVPKLLALVDLLKNKNNDDSQWLPIENMPYFDRVEVDSQIDLALAAALAELTMDEFYILNPAFNHWATSPKGPHNLLLPIEKMNVFEKNLKKIPVSERISLKRYVIKKGDSLISIAKKHNTSVDLLKQNNQIYKNIVREGKSLLIPVASKAREKYHKSTAQRQFAIQNKKRKGEKILYVVKPGDSIWTIAKKHQVRRNSLLKWNNLSPRDTLSVGKSLVIWKKTSGNFASLSELNKKTKKIYYKVKSGDSFARIASRFKVSLNNIKRWNKKANRKKYLQPGDSLTLYVDITQQLN